MPPLPVVAAVWVLVVAPGPAEPGPVVDVAGAVVVISGTVGRMGSVGTTTGRGTVGTVVLTQPITGGQSSGAAGAAVVNAPAARMPATRTTAPAEMRAAVASRCQRGVGGGEVNASLSLWFRPPPTVVNADS
jgi:hypothetical protein